MWTETLPLRVGNWYVGVRADSNDLLGRLRRLFNSYVIDAEPVSVRTNFGIRAGSGWFRRRAGLAYTGGCELLRSTSLDELAGAVAGHISALAFDAARTAVNRGRIVARGRNAVLLHAPFPHFVGEMVAGTREVHLGTPVIDAGRRIVVPPSLLPDLDWKGGRFRPPADTDDELQIVGVITLPDVHGEPNLEHTWLSSAGELDAWGVLLRDFADEGRVAAAKTADQLNPQLDRLLSS